MKRRLWLKILIPVSLIVFLVVALTTWLNIIMQEKSGKAQLDSQNLTLIHTIEGSMFDALSIGDNDTVRGQFQRIHEQLKNVKVFVYDFNGVISFSTDTASVGRNIENVVTGPGLDTISRMVDSGDIPANSESIKLENNSFIYDSRPIKNEAKCFHCHGASRKILGGISVFSAADELEANIVNGRRVNILVGVVGLCLIIFFVWAFFHFFVNSRIRQILEAMSRLRQGDFTIEMTVPAGDEMNHILARINMVSRDLREALVQVKTNSDEISKAALDLDTISGRLSDASTKTSENTTGVSAAAQQMSSGNKDVARSMEQSSLSLNTIASAVEEMSATVLEIAENVSSSKELTQTVVHDFHDIEKVVDQLGLGAEQVDGVTDEIRSISEQVSMLALNAKIEAARAGDAGKGFAVVAEEITSLAVDTANATIDADEKLLRMKQMTKDTISRVQAMAKHILDSDEAMTGISAAIEEQNTTIQEISKNISSVSSDMDQVNDAVSQGVLAAEEIAHSMASVEQDSQGVERDSTTLKQSADTLYQMAHDFEKLMERFKV